MDIGLYVHIPFCASKCYYCDFLSFPKKEEQAQYVAALALEMANVSESLDPNTHISTIFIGGGTPTVLPPVLIEQVLEGIVTHFHLTEDCEWTIEANPGTLTEEKINIMKRYPITRISMGLQSTHDHLLKKIGRGHTFKDWEESLRLVRSQTNWQINVDLMFALPDQTFEDFKETLETVASYDLDHLSVYALIIEEGTRFGELYDSGKLKEVPEELDRNMYHFAQEYLKEKGYTQYEISNWAKDGKVCKHNMVYWQLLPYIGMGLGAHSLYDHKRFYNEEKMSDYLKAEGVLSKLRYEEELLTPQMLMEEYMFLGLRLVDGIEEHDFERRFGRSVWDVYGKQLEHFITLGILIREKGRLFLSAYGMDVCNEVFSSFLESE